MPLYNAYAIVIRRTNFGETDRIATLYTRERGKVAAIAKGSRKPISRLAGSTEILTYGKFQLAGGRNLDIITQVDVKDSFPRIRGELSRIAYATYLAELIDKLVEEPEANPDIFDLFLSSLYLMERPNDPEKIAHMFELQFMKLLGYEASLDKCISCTNETSTDELSFSPSLGGIICGNCGYLSEDAIPMSPEAAQAMKLLIVAEAPEVERMEISPEAMEQMARAMRWYIRYRSDREIKSMQFLQSLKAMP